MTIITKKVSECSINHLVDVWNEGFQDYFVPTKLNADQMIKRMGMLELSPHYSFIAYHNDKPVGVILNGIRTMKNGKKVSWNGGTAVIPEYRSKGVGKLLVEQSLQSYKQESVDIATLEALSQNSRAIRLYEKMGYKTVDELHFYEKKEGNFIQLSGRKAGHYYAEITIAEDIGGIDFYPKDILPWQNDYRALVGGEALLIFENDHLAGYLLFKRRMDDLHKTKEIMIFQCEVRTSQKQDVIQFGLQYLQEKFNEAAIKTFNIPSSKDYAIKTFENAGFSLFLKQVFMVREM